VLKMDNILKVMKNRLRLKLKKKSSIFVYLFSPIIAVVVALVFNNIGDSNIRVGIYDADNSTLSKALIQELKGNERYTIYNIQKEYVDNLISNSKVDVAVVISENFEEGIINGEMNKVDIISLKDTNISLWIENVVNYHIVALNDISIGANGDKELFFKIYEKFINSNIKLTSIDIEDKTKNIGVSVQSIGLLLVFMFAGASMTSSTIIGDKILRVYQRIRISPLKKSEYILGNVMASLLLNIVQISIIMILSKTLLLKFYMEGWVVFLILLCFSTVAIGLGLFIASIAKSSSQASQLANVIIVPTSMLGGCFWPVYLMPEAMQKIAMLFPQSWVLKSFSDIQNGKGFEDIIVNLLIVLGFAILLFVLALINMRTKDDTKSFI